MGYRHLSVSQAKKARKARWRGHTSAGGRTDAARAKMAELSELTKSMTHEELDEYCELAPRAKEQWDKKIRIAKKALARDRK